MRRITCLAWCLMGFAVVSAQEPKSGPPPIELAGYWEGAITPTTIPLRFTFHFTRDAEGKTACTLQSHDEGFKDLPVRDVELADRTLTFSIPSARAKYRGTFNDAGDRINGTYQQGAAKLVLNLKRVAKPLELKRPQLPQRPVPYREVDLKVENAAAKVNLAGTLTLPEGKGPFPVIVLISGSGPQDRDETLLGHKPFRVLADYLTRRGIAVYRYDDRGVAASTGTFGSATTRDFADDVLAIVGALAKHPDVRPEKIGLMGHSEGGVIAPLVASESKHVAFIILLAGTGVPGDELLLMQSKAIMTAMKLPAAAVEKGGQLPRLLYPLIKDNATAEKLKEAGKEYFDSLTAAEKLVGGKNLQDQIDGAVARLATPWMRFFIRHDPRVALRQVTCPVLAINGERDLQVPAMENLDAIAGALKEAKNNDVTIQSLPELNHLFQTSKSGLPAEYGEIEETFAPAALEVIGEWLRERVK